MEVWKAIPGYEGSHEVSNRGRVRSLSRFVEYKDGRKPRFFKGKLLAIQSLADTGYHQVVLTSKGKAETFPVHTLVLLAFRGPKPRSDMECRHLDGNPGNNRLSNLKWGTKKENQQDRIRHGTDDNGEKSANARLTTSQVLAIRAEYKTGRISQSKLARKYGVRQGTISNILRRITWKLV